MKSSNILNMVPDIIKYPILIYICIVDIKRRIIPEKSFLILTASGFVKALINDNLSGYYLGICVFPMPLLILYIAEDYVKKELIGFGDIKLMMTLGGLLTYSTVRKTFEFYILLYILSGIFAMFLLVFLRGKRRKDEYVPFAPFIVMTYIIFSYLERS